MTETMLSTKEDRDMWKRLFEDCNKKQGEKIERESTKTDRSGWR